MEATTATMRRARLDKRAWSPDDSFRAFGEHVIAERIQRLLGYVKGVRRGTDPEAVHDMRVASRRLRAALDMFEPAFQHPDYERLRKEIRQVTDSLSRARDLDVMVLELGREGASTPPSQRGALGEIVRSCSSERRQLQRNVVAALDRLIERDVAAMFAGICEDLAQSDERSTTAADSASAPKPPKASARRSQPGKRRATGKGQPAAQTDALAESVEPAE